MRIAIDVAPAEAEAVITALRNRASYLKAYARDSATATTLERIAAQIERALKKA